MGWRIKKYCHRIMSETQELGSDYRVDGIVMLLARSDFGHGWRS